MLRSSSPIICSGCSVPNGGWPWLFHADRAVVVEPYEIYSVHQDAMAPMALLELTDLTGDDRYAAAVRAGLDWSTGHNELNVDLLDRERASPTGRSADARPSIEWSWPRTRRRRSRTARSRGSAIRRSSSTRPCRPYHLGWILEAWSGREHLVETPAERGALTSLLDRPDDGGSLRDRHRSAHDGRDRGRVREMVRERGLHQHVVVNAAKIVALDHDPDLLDVIRSCDMVNADGMSVVWASRVLGDAAARARGRHRPLRTARRSAASEDGTSVYFLGATEEVVNEVAACSRAAIPACASRAPSNGYWDDDAPSSTPSARATPDYLFLAIPSPRKEFWARDHLEALGVPFVMGVGGSFDVVAGKVARAPRWAQQTGFEWAWRLAQEPRRMWRRYLYTNTAFMRITTREWLRNRA